MIAMIVCFTYPRVHSHSIYSASIVLSVTQYSLSSYSADILRLYPRDAMFVSEHVRQINVSHTQCIIVCVCVCVCVCV